MDNTDIKTYLDYVLKGNDKKKLGIYTINSFNILNIKGKKTVV